MHAGVCVFMCVWGGEVGVRVRFRVRVRVGARVRVSVRVRVRASRPTWPCANMGFGGVCIHVRALRGEGGTIHDGYAYADICTHPCAHIANPGVTNLYPYP